MVSGNGSGKGGKSVMDLARRAGMLEAYRGGLSTLRGHRRSTSWAVDLRKVDP